MMAVLKPKSLQDLNEVAIPPYTVSEEMEYHRGYYDGFIQAVEAFINTPLPKRRTYDVLWDFWESGALKNWRYNTDPSSSGSEFPPHFSLKKE